MSTPARTPIFGHAQSFVYRRKIERELDEGKRGRHDQIGAHSQYRSEEKIGGSKSARRVLEAAPAVESATGASERTLGAIGARIIETQAASSDTATGP